MSRVAVVALGMMGIVGLAGCRTTTQVTELPRVDLNLEQGNRGYLVGTAPDPGERKTTRQMVHMTIELPGFSQGEAPQPPESLDRMIPAEPGTVMADQFFAGGSITVGPQAFDTYVVQKGDTLWSISAKPAVYGKATRWRAIFDANRDLLGNPDAVKAGMTLKIPQDRGDADTTYDHESITVTK